MDKLCFGLKLWSTNSNLIKEAKSLVQQDFFQFIELTPIPGTTVDPFLNVDVPFAVHITTERHGLNIADRNNEKLNFELINNSINWANQLEAKYLILHPGFGEFDISRAFLDEIKDSRILIENMPKVGLKNERMIGYSPEQIEELIGSGFGFCFDLNHAIKAAISLGINYKTFIPYFLKFNPSYFHIADGNLNNELDEHLNIGSGEYDFEFLLKIMKRNRGSYITLETPRTNPNSFEEDLVNLEELTSKI